MKKLITVDAEQTSKVTTEQFSTSDMSVISVLVMTQCAFVFFQTLLFPGTGLIGNIISGMCALMPWLMTCSKGFASRIVGLSVASIVTSPVFGVFWKEVISFWQQIL